VVLYFFPKWLFNNLIIAYEPFLNFDFIADLEPAFHSDADLDPASENNADPDPDPQPC